MKSYPEDLCAVAARVLWFETAEEALRFPNRFLAYLMTHGTLEEILVARKYYSPQDFEAVLDDPPTGIFDPQSWNYWNIIFKRKPVPPLPQRVIPNR
jgi:hypothetical protein